MGALEHPRKMLNRDTAAASEIQDVLHPPGFRIPQSPNDPKILSIMQGVHEEAQNATRKSAGARSNAPIFHVISD
jgi:hypothetical protein